MNHWRILHGDVREKLRELPDGSVQTCVTSPPYWGLRDYGVQGQIGLEPTLDGFLLAMVDVFAEVKRALRDDGTCWVNLGDTYLAQQGNGFNGQKRFDAANLNVKVPRPEGVKPKDLCGIPWRVAFALQADGWYLRSDIIWAKPNPMPESVTDRPTKAHEYIFLLSKSARYYYDAAAIAERGSDALRVQVDDGYNGAATKDYESVGVQNPSSVKARIIEGKRRAVAQHKVAVARGDAGYLGSNEPFLTRNKRTVWTVTTQPYPEAHFATFPEDLILPCILAGSRPGDTVLDPFNGSGTTGAVAIRHQRNYIGIELNAEYIALARKRISAVAPLFAEEVA